MKNKITLTPPHTIDISYRDLFSHFLPRWTQKKSSKMATSVFCRGEYGDVSFSVRTAWDAFLSVQNFQQGSEIILSGVNIPHMAEIIRLHGLKPVFVDLNEDTLLPSLDSIKCKRTEKTVAVLCAHLFGNWSSLEEHAQWCRSTGLLLIEDCAQCFMGSDFNGTQNADLTFFSFGTIKRATSLGGAIVFIRNSRLRGKMLALQQSYQESSLLKFRKKCVRIFLLKTLCMPVIYFALIQLMRKFGLNSEEILRDAVRGFPQADLLSAIRFRPHARLNESVCGNWKRTLQHDWLKRAQLISERVNGNIVFQGHIAGAGTELQTHWLLPVVSEDPNTLLTNLRRSGFDATRGLTSLCSLAGSDTPIAAALLSKVVYLPIRGG